MLNLKEATQIAKNPPMLLALEMKVEQLGQDLVGHFTVNPNLSDAKLQEAYSATFPGSQYNNPNSRAAYQALQMYVNARRELNHIYEHLNGFRPDFLGNDMVVGSKVVWPASTGSSGCYMQRGTVQAINPNGGLKVMPDTSRWGGGSSSVTLTTNAQYVVVVDGLVQP